MIECQQKEIIELTTLSLFILCFCVLSTIFVAKPHIHSKLIIRNNGNEPPPA